jgi:cellulose synthase operon protein B
MNQTIRSLRLLLPLTLLLTLILSAGQLLAQQQPDQSPSQTAPSAQQPPDQQSPSQPTTPSAQQPAQPPASQSPRPSGRQSDPSAQPPDQAAGGQVFAGTITKMGDKYVLQDTASGTKYEIDRQDLAKNYEGKQVRIKGILDPDGKTIHVK